LAKTDKFIEFAKNHQFIEGFQISIHDLRNPTTDAKLINSMEDYIKTLEKGLRDEARKGGERVDLVEEKRTIYFEKAPSKEADLFNFDDSIQDPETGISPVKVGGGISVSSTASNTAEKQVRGDSSSSTVSRQFRESLNIGFKRAMNLEREERYSGLSPEKYLRKKPSFQEQQPETQKQMIELTKESDDDEGSDCDVRDDSDKHLIPENENLTPAFNRCLFGEDRDEVFDNHKNFYSS